MVIKTVKMVMKTMQQPHKTRFFENQSVVCLGYVLEVWFLLILMSVLCPMGSRWKNILELWIFIVSLFSVETVIGPTLDLHRIGITRIVLISIQLAIY